MRRRLFSTAILATALTASSAYAGDMGVPQCDNFFAKYETCIAKLSGEQKENARISLGTLRFTMKMADSLNRGDPNLTGPLCESLKEETLKDADVQSYGCDW